MNLTKPLLALVLISFTALSLYALYAAGLEGLVAAVTTNPIAWTLATDLVIALGLVLVWMVRDARTRGVSVLPYVLLTLGLGSVGPLLYLLRRPASVADLALGHAPNAARSMA